MANERNCEVGGNSTTVILSSVLKVYMAADV